MKKIFLITLISLLFLPMFLLTTNKTLAAGILPEASGGNASTGAATCAGDKNYCGDYSLNDFVKLGINISTFILGIVGSLSLIMFIYGGVTFIISAGSSDKIAQAKKIITASIIGLLIVFTSFIIISFATSSLGVATPFIFDGKLK